MYVSVIRPIGTYAICGGDDVPNKEKLRKIKGIDIKFSTLQTVLQST